MIQKLKVNVSVTTGPHGSKRLRPASEAPPEPTPAPARSVPRVARMLALAHDWQGLIRSGTIRDRADLAVLVGVSRERVSQVMRLLDLAPDIQEAVLDGEVDGTGVEKALRAVASETRWRGQRQRLADTR